MTNFQISKHFNYYEMTNTTHRTYLAKNREAYLDKSLMSACTELCENILEPIRDHFGSPLIIHSGYRCDELNKAIGGSQNSQHRHFQAADFHIIGVDLTKVFEWIYKDNYLKFGQVILEGWAIDNPTWIHISLGYPFRLKDKCQEVLTMEAGKYKRL